MQCIRTMWIQCKFYNKNDIANKDSHSTKNSLQSSCKYIHCQIRPNYHYRIGNQFQYWCMFYNILSMENILGLLKSQHPSMQNQDSSMHMWLLIDSSLNCIFGSYLDRQLCTKCTLMHIEHIFQQENFMQKYQAGTRQL